MTASCTLISSEDTGQNESRAHRVRVANRTPPGKRFRRLLFYISAPEAKRGTPVSKQIPAHQFGHVTEAATLTDPYKPPNIRRPGKMRKDVLHALKHATAPCPRSKGGFSPCSALRACAWLRSRASPAFDLILGRRPVRFTRRRNNHDISYLLTRQEEKN